MNYNLFLVCTLITQGYSFVVHPLLPTETSFTRFNTRKRGQASLTNHYLQSLVKQTVKTSSSCTTLRHLTPPESTDTSSQSNSLLDQAKELKKQAVKARLEAEQMDAKLTLSRISQLESQLLSLRENEENTGNNEKRIQQKNDILNKLEQLKNRLESTSSLKKNGSKQLEIPTETKMETTVETTAEITTPTMTTNSQMISNSDVESTVTERSTISSTLTTDNSVNVTTTLAPVANNSLSPEQMVFAIISFGILPTKVQNLFAKSVGLSNDTDTSVIVESLSKRGMIEFGETPNFILDERYNEELDALNFINDDDEETYNKKRSVASDYLENLNDEKLVEDLKALYGLDMEEMERSRYVEAILPKRTRIRDTLVWEDLDSLYAKALGLKTFNAVSKPEAIPGGFIIRGENRMESSDEMIVEMDRRLNDPTNATAEAVPYQFYYIKDPTPFKEPEIDMGDLEEPVLVVFDKDVRPQPRPLIFSAVTIAGLLAVTTFAVGTYAINNGILMQVDESNVDHLLDDFVGPLVFSILGIQLAHEIGHRLIAIRDKFDIGIPTIIPSIQTGLTGCITTIKSPPKNLSSLFDFAISGPLLGMFASISTLFIGLEKTVEAYSMTNSQGLNEVLASLPSLPVEFLKLSTLGGSMVELILGSGVLLSPDPANTFIKLDPLVIAGYVGILVNALSLIPIGSTDGGRISLTLFGRPLMRFVQTVTVCFLLGIGWFGLDNSNIFLTYVIYAFFTQRENEIPCRNEVDDINFERVLIAIATGVLTILALTPITS